jgi:hypothetical protein
MGSLSNSASQVRKALVSAVNKWVFVLIVALVSFSAGKFSSPTKVETREVERVVYRDRTIKDVAKDVIKRTTVVTKPDGTVTRETIVEDRSKAHSDSTSEGSSEKSVLTKVDSRPDWRIGGIFKPDVYGFQTYEYAVTLERRIIGEVYAGLSVSSDKTLGIVLSIGF